MFKFWSLAVDKQNWLTLKKKVQGSQPQIAYMVYGVILVLLLDAHINASPWAKSLPKQNYDGVQISLKKLYWPCRLTEETKTKQNKKSKLNLGVDS